MRYIASISFLNGKVGAVDLGEGRKGVVDGEEAVLKIYCMRKNKQKEK